MEEQQRDFKGIWIPKEVWLDERLSALDKMILLEIDSLDKGNGCYASNEYLAKFCQCSETKISTAISKLIELQYLKLQSFDGRKRILKSRLTKSERQGFENQRADIQKIKQSNIIEKQNRDNKYNAEIDEIVAYLNEKAKTAFRTTTPKTRQLITARISEGYTVADFRKVIDNKVAEWKGDSKMQAYLRPETLFGTKFESYLQQRKVLDKSACVGGTEIERREYSDEDLSRLFTPLDDDEDE